MAKRGVKTSVPSAVAGKTTDINKVSAKAEIVPRMAYSKSYSGQRIASTNIPVYKNAGGDIVGVIASRRRVTLTGTYVDFNGERYVEVCGLGFVKDYNYLR